MKYLRSLIAMVVVGLFAGSVFAGTKTLNTFESTSLGRAMTYWVYLPSNYDAKVAAGEKFSVIYLLHWYQYAAQGWHVSDGTRVCPLMETTIDSVHNVIGIAPQDESIQDGRGTSWWVNSQFFGKYGDFVSKDLVAEVNTKYTTYGDSAHNGITGCSMGGFGALHHIRANKNVFSKGYGIVSLTDLSKSSRTGALYNPAGCLWGLCSIFGTNYWGDSDIQSKWAPIAHAADYAGVKFGFSSSTGDFFKKDNDDFAAALKVAGVTSNYVCYNTNEAHEYPTPARMTGILKFLFEDGPAPGVTASILSKNVSSIGNGIAKPSHLSVSLAKGNSRSVNNAVGIDGRAIKASASGGIIIKVK